jgi:hypothetical protein
MMRSADAGKPGADDQHVEMLIWSLVLTQSTLILSCEMAHRFLDLAPRDRLSNPCPKNQLGADRREGGIEMRLIKMLGLAAVAAMAAMAFVGATSASAASTQLCNSHSALTCGEGQAATSVSVVGVGVLLGETLDIVCRDIDASGTPLALANPQQIHVSGLDFKSCETSGGDGCVVTVNDQPLSNLNKTGLDSGTLTATNGFTFVECEDVFGSLDVQCEYDATGLVFTVGSQHLTAEETPVDEVGSDFLCPNEPALDGFLVTTAIRFVLA